MDSRATLVVTLLLLVATPVAGAAADDDAVNATATPTMDANTSTDDGETTETNLTGSVEGTVNRLQTATGTVGSTVDSTSDAVDDTDVTNLVGVEGTSDVEGEVDAAADALGGVHPAVRESLTSLEDGAADVTDDGSTAPAMTTGGAAPGATGPAAVAPPGRGQGDGASGGGDGVAATVGAGVILAGLVARGSMLANAGAALSGGTGASPGTRRSRLGRLVRALVPLRYSRRDDSDPLEHDDRARLMDVIESRPGTYLTAVAEAADLNLSTARHHLKVLEREGLVERASLRGRRRLFPANAESQALAAALSDDATAAVLDALARVGPCSTSELADELDRDPSTMSHHLQRLEADELVVRERDGRAQVARLAPEVAEVLAGEPPEAPTSSTASAAD